MRSENQTGSSFSGQKLDPVWFSRSPRTSRQSQTRRICCHPDRVAERAIVLRGAANQFDVGWFLTLVHHSVPVAGLRKRPRGKRQIGAILASPPEASPSPGFGAGHEAGTHRVSLNVAQHGEEMSIVLNRNRPIATLVHVTGSFRVVTPMPALRVRQGQPVHESRQFVIHRPQHKMPVIWHDAVGEQPNGKSLQRLDQRGFEQHVVGVGEEQAASLRRPVQNVKRLSVGVAKRSARHVDVECVEQQECLSQKTRPGLVFRRKN